MFTDTHCHLTAEALWQQRDTIIANAQAHDVSSFIVPATQAKEWQTVLFLQQHPAIRAVGLGIHPWWSDTYHDDLFEKLISHFTQHSHLWLGEVGLDKRIQIPYEKQIVILEKQLQIAHEFHRPVILHNVHSSATLLTILKRISHQYHGIVHGFSGSLEEANQFIKQGFKIGIGSLLLRENTPKVHQLATQLPLPSLLLETDSPYMLKNQVNTPSNIRLIAEKVAAIRGISLVNLATQLEDNLQTIFQAAF